MTWVADTPFTAPRWSEPGAVESAAARPFTPTRPPRHVHLIPSLSLGGAERIVADLACCYAECGTAADLVILRNSAVEHPLRAGTGAGEGTGAGVAVHRLGALPWPERHARATEVIRASGLPAYCHLLSAPDLARLWRLGCRTVPVVHNAAAGWTADPAGFDAPEVPFVAACGEAVALELAAAGLRTPVRVLRHVVPAPEPLAPSRRAAVRAAFGAGNGTLLVSMVGRSACWPRCAAAVATRGWSSWALPPTRPASCAAVPPTRRRAPSACTGRWSCPVRLPQPRACWRRSTWC